jgi:tRNA(fMet)-specific endonuclease VapC
VYALDTNTLIYFFKGLGRVADALHLTSPSDIAVPAIVLYELEIGIAQSTSPAKRRQQLDALVSVVTVLAFDAKAARRSAEVASTLFRSGKIIGSMDLLIAGTALANDAILVTHNTKEFRRVKGLQLTDWY